MRRLTRVTALLLAIALLTGCAAGRAFRSGDTRARVGDWDAAVVYYRTAVLADPDKAEYRIALERAMLNASRTHFDSARQFEASDQLDAALLEYRKTTEFDPSNRQAADKVVQLERIIRDRIEAARPRPQIVQLREQTRLAINEPLLNPASREPIDLRFTQASLRDILTFIGNAYGINITYDASFQDRPFSANLTGTLEQLLNTVLTSNALFYAILDQHTILIAQDTNPNRLKYERQVIVTFPVSYADVTELAAMLTTITRTTTAAIPPIITPNRTANTITVRSTSAVMDVIRELIVTNDKPRAEITLDVEILEVNRNRAKDLGLDLTAYQVTGTFSPEVAPPGAAGAGTATTNGPFNLNTISQGVSTADFYLALPQAIVKFLETDTQTKVLLQTQLRGAEGTQLSLNIGAREPYLTTTFSPIAAGGANVNPLSSYSFEQVGISVTATPRVTEEGDIVMPLALKKSALGPPRSVGGSPAPSFTNREIIGNLRLRDGESHLLAGLLEDDERKTLTGFPGIASIPILRELFSNSDSEVRQTDIVMLITPRIIRTHEYTARDLAPIYVGTNQNFGLTGPPPLIATPPETPDLSQPPAAVPTPAPAVPPQGLPVPSVPQSGTPGLITTPAQITVTAPTGEVRVAGGPYMVPVFINGVSRLSTITVTVSYNPGALRVRTIQEGSFLRQGGATAAFTSKVDATFGRVDLTFVRTGDTVGASGSGLLAGVIFDAVGTGTSQLNLSGVATDPSGNAIPVQFAPASVVVR